MAYSPSSSGIVNKEKQPLISEEVQNETPQMPERADSVPSKGSVVSTADSASTSGNVPERQDERSLWREKMEHRLRITKERWQCETHGFGILKVGEYHRQPPEMFTPQGWRFGLHNLDNVDRYAGSEALKLCVPLSFGLDEVQKWEKFCDYVVTDPGRMLGCYGLHKEDINLNGEEIKQLLTFDALCIALRVNDFDLKSGEKLMWTGNDVSLSEEQGNMLSSMGSAMFSQDLWRVENQIPLELITRVMGYIKRLKNPSFQFDRVQDRTNGNVELLDTWMKGAVRTCLVFIGDDSNAQEMSDLRLFQSHHILDAAYKVICGKDGLERVPDEACESYIHIPSAIELKHAGVKIEGVGGPLCTMSYNKMTKSFILPKMRIYDQTFAFIRNMAMYEANMNGNTSMFCDYILLMLDLIKTLGDMEYLIKCGVIINHCGSRAFEKWQALNEGLTEVLSSIEHNAMKEDIKRRHDEKLPKLWKEFRTLFCSRPWLIVPVIAATLVTIATLIQAYAAIIGSDRMMPHYKNP